MKDEKKAVKEIIKYLKKRENTRNLKCITLSERNLLLDYIFDLHFQNKQLKKYIMVAKINEYLKDDDELEYLLKDEL